MIQEGALATLNPEDKQVFLERLLREKRNRKANFSTLDIAVVGISGRFPDAENTGEFWQNLSTGKNSVREVPEARWKLSSYFDTDKSKKNKSYSHWAALIDGIDKFDPLFFGLSPAEAEEMDPQQRLFLQECWHAFEDAGYAPLSQSQVNCGVFVGVGPGDYTQVLKSEGITPNAMYLMGNANSILAARISYALDLIGPNIVIDTACSSGLVAIHQACQSIESGESDMALAGAVSIMSTPEMHIQCCKSDMLSVEGKCKTFDNRADGFVPGEAVGAVVLKKLKNAVEDNDHIYGVIKGSGINQDGKTNGITAPSAVSQAMMQSRVYDKYGIDPGEINYIEAHGTGTVLGDPIEVKALTNSFRQKSTKEKYCAIGSVKTNVGHTLNAAGMTGFIKLLLCLKHRQLVPSLNCEQVNEHINFRNSPFYVNKKLKHWEPVGDKRLAAINSFGFSGTNCHLVVEEAPTDKTVSSSNISAPLLICISAFSKLALTHQCEKLREYIEKLIRNSTDSALNHSMIEAIAYTLNVGRSHFKYRLVLLVTTIEELLTDLANILSVGKGSTCNQIYFRGNSIEPLKPNGEIRAPRLKDLCSLNEVEYQRSILAIASRYVLGVDINWKSYYQGFHIKKISLPGYVFSNKRYWINDKNINDYDVRYYQREKGKSLHPLIDTNQSTFEEQCFTKRFDREEFYVRDHVVGGSYLVPGAAQLEMARAAGQLALINRPVEVLRDIVWLKSIQVPESGIEVGIRLIPDGFSAQYEIYSEDGGKEIIFSKGVIHYKNELAPTELSTLSSSLDLSKPLSLYNEILDAQTFYKKYEDFGIQYGSSFRSISEMVKNGNCLVGKLTFPKDADCHDENFALHPALLDSAFQSMLALDWEILSETESRYLPVTVDSLIMLERINQGGYVEITRNENTTESSKCRKYDLTIYNETGKAVVYVGGLGMYPMDSFQVGNSVSDDSYAVMKQDSMKLSEEHLVTYSIPECVEEVRQPIAVETPIAKKSILLIARHEMYEAAVSHANELLETSAEYDQFVVVNPDCGGVDSEPGQYRLDTNDPDCFITLFDQFDNEGISIDAIIHYLPNDIASPQEVMLAENAQLIFLLTQALLRKKGVKAKVIALFDRGSSFAPFSEMTIGLARCVYQENNRIALKIVGIEPASLSADGIMRVCLDELNDELFAPKVIHYIGETRLVGRYQLQAIDFPAEIDCDENLMDDQDTLLISGGAGGLGLVFAEHFLKNGAKHIVLLGRSLETDQLRKKRETIDQTGRKLLYKQVDITDLSSLECACSELRHKFGEITGVIHGAGIIEDRLTVDKTLESFKSVIAPKVVGTVNLDRVTKDDKLKFFVSFSSVASALGNVGQSDYAAGNAFLDSFSRLRDSLVVKGERRGKSLSINWPLWEEGGMRQQDQSNHWMKRKLGMSPLSAVDGVKAFGLALSASSSQIMVIDGVHSAIESHLNGATRDENVRQSTIDLDTPLTPEESEKLIQEIETALIDDVSHKLKLESEDIDLDMSLSEFGFDSITLTQLSDELNERFQIDLTPAIFFEHDTLNSLAKLLYSDYSVSLRRYFSDSHCTDGGKMDKSFDQLSTSRPILTSGDIQSKIVHRPFLKNPSSEKANLSDQNIAIVGMHGVFPKSENLEIFWENLVAGKDLISEVSSDRWDWKPYHKNLEAKGKKANVRWGGFIADHDKFDYRFFGISPREAALMDPQHRLLLESVWSLIANAGYSPKSLSNSKTGLFIGASSMDYMKLLLDNELSGAHVSVGLAHSMLANRISYLLNLKGPSEAIDTACSSSLVSIHHAVRSLLIGECDMAIAGGVNMLLIPDSFVSFSDAGMLNPEGRCKTFDKHANGYVRGEGVGTIMMKPLVRAQADGDYIHAVIKGVATNHGGHTQSLTAPNPIAQADVIVEALNKSSITPNSISYIEAHGTGTELGDPVEINGLKKAFGQFELENDNEGTSSKNHFCGLGTVKTNIGHLEAAAGIAGVLKVLLSLKHKKIPANIHFEEMNPYIDLKDSPFYIVDESKDWKPLEDADGNAIPRRAGISSFGFGGTNAHVILEEYSNNNQREPNCGIESEQDEDHIFMLSAKNKSCLHKSAKDLLSHLESEASDGVQPEDIAFTLSQGREHMEERLAIIASNKNELKERLKGFLTDSNDAAHVFYGTAKRA